MKRWIPWRFILSRAARSYGVLDPVGVLARLRRFAQPSEVQEPIELLRAGIVFHARGLINARAIQHNLDWVWPYWVERQFNPRDVSFIPRGFSFSQVNLTQRNWTAVGQPDLDWYPIVDPRGLVTPLLDGWSIDCWVLGEGEAGLFPSRLGKVAQRQQFRPNLAVTTAAASDNRSLTSRVSLERSDREPLVRIAVEALAGAGGRLVVALRPYNPEGIQFIDRIEFSDSPPRWTVNGTTQVLLSERPQEMRFSCYRSGDLLNPRRPEPETRAVACDVGMATAGAFYRLEPGVVREITVEIPQPRRPSQHRDVACRGPEDWEAAVAGTATLAVPDPRWVFLHEASLRTLLLLSANEIVPGPYTYRRFWFRDACLMGHALLVAGLPGRVRRLLEGFPARQQHSGYFRSQEGEWDSNGQVLWLADRYERLSGERLGEPLVDSLLKGAGWVLDRRVPLLPVSPHAGLFPPGFSAEHFGPNDYYYWDDLWGVAGLRAAAAVARRHGRAAREPQLAAAAAGFTRAIDASIATIPVERARGAWPASPYRRLDAGAVGSLVADYPLQLTAPGDGRIVATANFLVENCFHEGAFFEDVIHSGLNPYLTLAIAQTLLRCGDIRHRALAERVRDLASATGHWPEAVHPFSGGGCMGDGQHGWAAAEWLMMTRSLFVREEGDGLILGSGVHPAWLEAPARLAFGPTLTPWGPVSVGVRRDAGQTVVRIDARWRERSPTLEIRLPGHRSRVVTDAGVDHRLEADVR